MEFIYICCIIVLTISVSIALMSISKKNFAAAKAMGTVDTLVDSYNSIFEKMEKLFDKVIEGEIY